jgi:hypothetical protein
MPFNRTSNYTTRTERWCRVCNARTSQTSCGCHYSTPEKLKVPNVLIRNVTWICQSCDHGEAESKEVALPSDRMKIIRRFLSLSDDYDLRRLVIEAGAGELVFRVRLPDFDMGEMRAIQYKQEETGFITVDELMKVQRAGYTKPTVIPPKPQPQEVVTLRKRERQRAFAEGPRPYDC